MKIDWFVPHNGRRARCAVALLLWLIVAGCAGITPEEVRNTREEGPEKGLFSGPGGEFVLIGPAQGEPQAERDKEPEKEP